MNFARFSLHVTLHHYQIPPPTIHLSKKIPSSDVRQIWHVNQIPLTDANGPLLLLPPATSSIRITTGYEKFNSLSRIDKDIAKADDNRYNKPELRKMRMEFWPPALASAGLGSNAVASGRAVTYKCTNNNNVRDKDARCRGIIAKNSSFIGVLLVWPWIKILQIIKISKLGKFSTKSLRSQVSLKIF